METRANYAIIGIFTLAAIAAGFGFVFWFSGSERGAKRTPYRIEFTSSVAGLAKGASVLFNGIRVGEVTDVYFDVNQPSKAFARIEVQPDTPVREDTRAALDVALLSGAAVVALNGGEGPKLEKKADEDLPTIIAERGGIGSLLDTARNTADEATRLIVAVNGIIGENRGTISSTLGNLQTFSQALADNAPAVNEALASVGDAAKRVGPLAIKLETLANDTSALVRAVEPERVSRVVRNVEEFSQTVADNRGRVTNILSDTATLMKGLSETAPKLDGALTSFNTAAESIAPAATRLGGLADEARGVLRAIEPGRVTRIVENVDGLMATVGENRERVAEVLRNTSSLTQRLNDAAPKLDGVLASFNAAAESIAPVANRLGTLVDDARGLVRSIDPGRVTRIVENADGIMTTVNASRDQVTRIVGNLDGVMATVGENRERVAEVLRNTASLTQRLNDTAPKLDGLLATFNAAGEAIAPVANRLGTLVDDARGVVRAVEPARVTRIVENADGIMATVAENRERVSDVLRNTASLTQRLNETAPKLDSFMTTVARVAENLNPLSAKLSTLTDSVANRVQAIDPEQVKRIVANANQFMGGLSSSTEDVQSTVRNANELTGKLNRSADRIDGLIKSAQDFLGSAAGKEGKSTFEAVRLAAVAFQKASENLDRRATEIAQGVSRLSGVGSRQVESLGTDARRAVNSVGRAAQTLERNPSSVIFGTGRAGIPEYGGR